MNGSAQIVVIGAGAFGTALAAVMAKHGQRQVTLLSRSLDLTRILQKTRMHAESLPGIPLPSALAFSADPRILEGADIVLFAMPSQAQREAALVYGPRLKPDAKVVICAKGIDKSSGLLLSDVVGQALQGQPVAVLSGPGFAADIAKGLPTAMVLASATLEEAEYLANALSTPTFRLYASQDRIGVQLGGALKNVLAIACGIVEGAGLGDSARAALIARGLAEMTRFVVAQGGLAETVPGLSGLGDLVLTATSHQSRNLRYGLALGQGIADRSGNLVEGALAASVSGSLAKKLGIDMPITAAVAAIVDGQMDVRSAMQALMSRPITQE
jgi:glycerol-3-phosphate dehydrogenase (NAD(P)+)